MAAGTVAARADALRSTPLFARLSRSALQKIARATTDIEAEPGTVLIEAGRPGQGMFVLIKGKVEVQMRGRRAELGPGDFFGEIALLRPDAVRTARVVAKTRVHCLAIDRASFSEILTAHPQLAISVLETALRRLAEQTVRPSRS
jgi:CRP-like cAMP-binding protein